MRYSRTVVLSIGLLGLAHLAASAKSEPLLERKLQKLSPVQLSQMLIPEQDREVVQAAVDVDADLFDAQGEQEVIIQFKTPPVAAMEDSATKAERQAHKQRLEYEHASFMQDCGARSAQEIGGLTVLLNALFLNVDAREIEELMSDPNVLSIHRVEDFEKSLDRRVPYIGATSVQQDYGFDGTGVSIAILDSGIDYTHADLGGNGTAEAWDAAYKDFTARDGLFPTEKVVEGFDFVGEAWPNGPLRPDDDPIDIDGHGTHCADIAAGVIGVAPGASLLAVKVCSATSSRCSGVALLQGMEYAVDPDGDGDTSDHVDIINMSLGRRYGQPFDDDLSQAVNRASTIGVLTVCAAGNGRNRPYVTNTPAAAFTALSVAQTLIPSETPIVVGVDGEDYPTVYQSWSAPLEPEEGISGPFQYANGDGGNVEGCMEFPAGSLDGKMVLVDRGNCTFTLKASNIGKAGAIAAIIGMVNDDPPFDSGDGGDPVTIPAYMISLESSNSIKAMLTVNSVGTLDPDNSVALPSRMAASSSRGPVNDVTNLLKPEIGAPGGSVSALASSGTSRTPFGGTSAASPVVAGAAALLLQAYPNLTPAELKARLMNSAEKNVLETENMLAPISRIGSGDVKVDRSLTARTAAWDADTEQPALSFGFQDIDKKQQFIFKTLFVRNYSNETIQYRITPTFRYEDDRQSGAVKVYPNFPGELQLLPGEDRNVSIVMELFGKLLPGNYMNSGREGNNASALTVNEYDGFLELEDLGLGLSIHVPWHLVPRKAANVKFPDESLDFSTDNPTTVDMSNEGAGAAQIGTFSIIALSDDVPEGGPGEQMPFPDIRAVGISTLEVDEGVCTQDGPSFIWAFAISTWERQAHLISVRYEILLDVDQDGRSDYRLLNSDFDGPSEVSNGRQVSLVINRQTGRQSRVFFAEHAMNTANTVLYICAEQIGLSSANLTSTNVGIPSIRARDFSFGGPGDIVEDLVVTPGGEQYTAVPVDLGPFESGMMPVGDRGPFDANTREYGLMVMTNNDRGPGMRGGATQASELSLLLA